MAKGLPEFLLNDEKQKERKTELQE